MFNLINLNEVRNEIISEIESDINQDKLYISEHLNPNGKILWPKKLLEAAESMSVDEFTNSFSMENFNPTFERRKPKGGFTTVTMAHNANARLCEGELNRFYIRGVCLKAIATNQELVTCYRARPSDNPRQESIAVEGKQFNAEQLLKDLRINIGVDTALGLPAGPNSGMSIKL